MEWDYLHLIKGDTINLAYHYPSFSLLVINDVTYNMINSLKAGITIQEVYNTYNVYENSILSHIQSLPVWRLKETDSQEQIPNSSRRIHRITLHVSNDCNLRCKYCYAGGGNYSQPRGLMTKQTAKTFVDFCIENFENINQIAFFGGEPLFNIEIMEYVCNQFKVYYTEGKSSFLPQFGLITNGTILTGQSIEFIKHNISHITVSIDGPQKANDANRIYKNGRGSYEDIRRFIHKIHKETNIPIRYEATFTQYHINTQCQYNDITTFLFKEFGIEGSIERENGLAPDYLLDYWKTYNYDDLTKTNFMNVPEAFWSILNVLVHKNKKEICPVIKNIFAVGIDGNIYPCHMLNGVMKNCLGNIGGKNIFNTPALYESCSSMLHLKQNKICTRCWGQNFCSGCAVKKFYKKETESFAIEPKTELCSLFLLHLEHILLMITTIRTNPDIWSALLAKAKERQTISHKLA